MSDAAKKAAAVAAAELVRDGMVVGLGTGSTAAFAIRRLGERVREGLAIVAIPTSEASAALAREIGIELVGFDRTIDIDLTIDGADEADPELNLIKGGGGALLREKVVASRSRELVIIVDPSKLVERLGAFPLPVEVVPFASRPVAEALRALGGEPVLRHGPDGQAFVTDNGNHILDLRFAGGIDDPKRLEPAIDEVPGVVESGLFIALADRLLIGRADGIEERTAR